MRRITIGPVFIFCGLLFAAIAVGVALTGLLLGFLPASDYRGIAGVTIALGLVYADAIVLYRLFLLFAPLREGPIPKGSRAEFTYHVYLLFYLMLFQPLTRSLFVPVPLMRLLYVALGARLGKDAYSAGVILDPPLTEIGKGSIVGHDAVLFAHAVEGEELSLARICIGERVTIGAKAVIMPDVRIEDDAIVAVCAVVTKGTRIGAGELWAGIPARKVERKERAA